MITLANSLLKLGARLRYPLHDARGILLLNAGATITGHLLELLGRRGIRLQLHARLRVDEGGPVGQEIPIGDQPMTLGRRPDCDIRPDSAFVSGHHCRLSRSPSGVSLVDLGSRNGTYLNDQRITAAVELSDQDTIQVGDVVFTVHLFAAVTSDTEEGNQAIRAWVVADGRSPPPGPYGATEMFLDLDAPPSPAEKSPARTTPS